MLSVLRRCYPSQLLKLTIEVHFIVISAKFSNLGERKIAGRQIKSCSCHAHKNQILLKGNAKQLFIDKLKIRFTNMVVFAMDQRLYNPTYDIMALKKEKRYG